MSGPTITYRFEPTLRASHATTVTVPGADSTNVSPRSTCPEKIPMPRVTRLLSLAHYIERCVVSGHVKDYATAARKIGITRARMSQILLLLNLAPAITERILAGEISSSERRLRPVASSISWNQQASQLSEIEAAQ